MGGTLYYRGAKPEVGDTVFVAVDSTSFPKGLWEGRLIELGRDYTPTREGFACGCVAFVTDPAVGDTVRDDGIAFGRRDRPPSFNYSAYDPLAAVAYLRARREDDRQKMERLKMQLSIERATFHALFKSLLSDDAIAKFEEVLQKLTRKVIGPKEPLSGISEAVVVTGRVGMPSIRTTRRVVDLLSRFRVRAVERVDERTSRRRTAVAMKENHRDTEAQRSEEPDLDSKESKHDSPLNPAPVPALPISVPPCLCGSLLRFRWRPWRFMIASDRQAKLEGFFQWTRLTELCEGPDAEVSCRAHEAHEATRGRRRFV